MIAKHTLTHAIEYLREAQVTTLAHGWEHATKDMELMSLRVCDPHKPCSAYVLARRTLKRCGSLAGAITDLEKQLEEA